MIVDAHVHVAHLARLKLSWDAWIGPAGPPGHTERWAGCYDDAGAPVPARVAELFAADGVDRVLLFCEYSPKATGWQPIEDMLPIVEHDPGCFRVVANVNPHVHHPVAAELDRQLDLGAVALKIHPVHAGIDPHDRALYPAYARCVERGVPVIVHTGPSTFPGSTARHGDPVLLDDVLRDFPELVLVLAHGGRGWSYDAAASLALTRENVWLDVAGLPPRRLPTYYERFGIERVARKMIFGTDSPAASAARNVAAIRELGLGPELTDGLLGGHAVRVFPGIA